MAENSLTNEDIDNYINDLVGFLGVKEDAPTYSIEQLLSSGKIKEGIKSITHYLGLPIDINITYDDRFNTTSLARTEADGSEGITAQVDIPSYLPSYGSKTLNNFPIHIKISKSCNAFPKTLICLVAHELSHILLYSLNYKGKNNEFVTDLTAMLLGFNSAMRRGRKTEKTTIIPLIGKYTNTTTYGYFTDEQFDYAYEKISMLLRELTNLKTTLQDKMGHIQRNVLLFKKDINIFRGGLAALGKKAPKRINPKDAHALVEFHSIDYLEKYLSSLIPIENKILKIKASDNRPAHYTNNIVSQINEINALLLSFA